MSYADVELKRVLSDRRLLHYSIIIVIVIIVIVFVVLARVFVLGLAKQKRFDAQQPSHAHSPELNEIFDPSPNMVLF